MPELNKIFHANCYIDGTTNLLGRFSELKLPDIAPTQVEHKGVGMFGSVELPAGLAALTLTVKWNGFYADITKFQTNPFKGHRLQIRGNVETHTSEGRVAEVPLIVTVSGRWKKAGGRTFKPMESGETDDEVACTYIKADLNGEELYEIDVHANIYRVAGEDLLETMRQNIGAS